MAKTKLSEVVKDIRGSVGQHVHSGWRGKSYIRSKAAVRSNPRSTHQNALRNRMSAASKFWKTDLTDAERNLWNNFADAQRQCEIKRTETALIIPYHGYTISGFNAFVAVNALMLSAGHLAQNAFLRTPPSGAGSIPGPTGLAASWGTIYQTVYSENFDTEVFGSTPDLWTPPWLYLPAVANIIFVQTPPFHSPPYCAELHSLGAPSALAGLAQPALSLDSTMLTFYASANQTNAISGVIYTANVFPPVLANYAIAVTFWNDSTIRYHNGVGWQIAQPYIASTWYKFTYVMHDPVLSYDLYIDDAPIALGIPYRNPVNASYLVMSTAGADIAIVRIDDIVLQSYDLPAILLSWSDPPGVHNQTRMRVWLKSEQAHIFRQLHGSIFAGNEAYGVSSVRIANGQDSLITNHKGFYQIQLDAVSPSGERSAPSNLVSFEVP